MLDIIEKRISRRDYIDKKLDKKDVVVIEELIAEINHDSMLDCLFVSDAKKAFKGLTKSYGLFHNVNSVIVLKGPNYDDLREDIGYFGEKLVLKATEMNLGTCWVGGSFDHKYFTYPDQDVICILTIGYVDKKRTMREKLIHNLLHNNKVNDFYKANRELTKLELDGLKAIELAPSAKNRKVVKVNYIDDETVISTIDDYFFDMVDLGIAKLHYEMVTGLVFDKGNNARINN